MYLGSLEERQARGNEIKLVTAALYEAKVKDEEILRVLMKVCDADREEATNAFRNEKFMLYPCRALYQYNDKFGVRWLLSKFKIKPNIYYNYRVLLFTKYHTKYEQSRVSL